MASNHSQDVPVDGDPDEFNAFIKECLREGVYVWHTWDIHKGTFEPTYRMEKAVTFCANRTGLLGATDVACNYELARPYMRYFNSAFSIVGAIMPELHAPVLVVPVEVGESVTKFMREYNLTDYRDLVWHLLFRLQVIYTQRIEFDVMNADYTKLIRNSKQSHELLIDLITHYMLPEEESSINAVSLLLQHKDGSKVLNDRYLAWRTVDDIVRAGIKSLFKEGLSSDWKEVIRNYDASDWLKHDFEYLSRRFSNAFIEFLRDTGLVNAESKLSYQYLKPIAAILNLSEYPFNRTELDVKNIQSLLKNQEDYS